MAAAANYGRANSQLPTVATRMAFAAVLGVADLDLLYDVSHNLTKLEHHDVDGVSRLLCCTARAAPAHCRLVTPELPDDLRPFGQPVSVAGSMGTASHVLARVEGGGAFHSTCHEAGRIMSRHAASPASAGGICATARRRGHRRARPLRSGLAEEAPFSYKDVDEVVATCEEAGRARRVARLRPTRVVKG
jgi:tRNA-splicing ligase RtcB (3'-phosphate/5'-hydroxy nucleic acid ligase)